MNKKEKISTSLIMTPDEKTIIDNTIGSADISVGRLLKNLLLQFCDAPASARAAMLEQCKSLAGRPNLLGYPTVGIAARIPESIKERLNNDSRGISEIVRIALNNYYTTQER